MMKRTCMAALSLVALGTWAAACVGDGGEGYAPVCGDGIVEGGEQCDDGNRADNDMCLSSCVLATCGDGKVFATVEVCDDGNVRDGDACAADCSSGAGCGNGVLDPGEACDDGNQSNADGCLKECKLATCGDGFAQLGAEECDDGNQNNDDGCSTECKLNGAEPGGCPGLEMSVNTQVVTSVVGDTTSAKDSGTGSCAKTGSKDIVYQVVPKDDGWLTVTVTGINGSDPLVHVKSGDCSNGQELACADNSGSNGTETVTLEVTGGTSYFVYADGAEAADTQFSVSLALSTEVPGDSCPGTLVTLEGNDEITLEGNTSQSTSDYKGQDACDASKQTKELVYSVKAKVDGVLTVQLDPDFDAVLYARVGSCTNGMQVACSDASWFAGGPEDITINAVAGTTYSVFADGYQGESGNYSISMKLVP